MKNLGKISAFLLILIFTLSFGQEAKEDSVQITKSIGITDSILAKGYQFKGKLKGVVFDEDGNFVKGAVVIIEGTNWKSETDAQGNYSIQNIRKGRYSVFASDSTGKSDETYNVVIEDEYVKSVNFILYPKSDLKDIEIEVIHEQKVEKDVTYKPIIYIYPEKETEVNVKLNYDGTFTATYPKYPENGWTVTAKPDGTLKDKSGKEYYSLFWEGVTDRTFTLDEGFVIRRENSVEFLENSLKTLGLNFREANEFIIFWLPELERHPYNLIHFSTKEYEELAELAVNPVPDTVIRVFMVFKGLDKSIEAKPQTLVPKVRKGFTVIEWGGSKISHGSKKIIN
jgi:hypothetical protein